MNTLLECLDDVFLVAVMCVCTVDVSVLCFVIIALKQLLNHAQDMYSPLAGTELLVNYLQGLGVCMCVCV